MEKVAVVILNWNGKSFLEKFLPGVIKNSPGCIIYVADNNSTDDSINFVSTSFPEVRIIRNPSNEGYSHGYNQALAKITAEYYVLLNSDVEVTPNWVDPIIKLMDERPTIGACQPKIKSYYQREYFEYAGAAGGYIDNLGYPFCRGRIFDKIEKDFGQYDADSEIFWASGACMFVRSKAFHQCSGLDSDFFAHMEEIDLCWRMQNYGWQIYYCGQSEVYHVGGGSLSKSNPLKTYLNFRNSIAMLIKNLPPSKFHGTLIRRFFMDAPAGLKLLFSGGFGHFWALIRAHFFIYTHWRQIKLKRNPSKTNIHITGLYPKSIIYDFYIKRRKTFQDLNF